MVSIAVMGCDGLKKKSGALAVAALPLAFCLALGAQAATYVQPNGDVVGQIQYTTARAAETLLEIARRYDVGFNAIKAANPHIDPWLPPEGARILIPSRYILPPGPREGIVINVAEMNLYYYYTPQVAEPVTIQLTPTNPESPAAPPAAASAAKPQPAPPAIPSIIPRIGPQIGSAIAPKTAPQATAPAAPAAPPLQPSTVQIVPEVPVVGPPLVSIYPISISQECLATPLGSYRIEQRLSSPSWTVPARLRREQPGLPEVMPPGPNNPLGEYAITLDNPALMIHGTNKASSIGMKVSRGCVRMYPEDIDLLIHRVSAGTPVRLVNQAVKHGYKRGALYLEFHRPEAQGGELNLAALVNWMSGIVAAPMAVDDWQRVRLVAEGGHGLAMPVAQLKARSRPESSWLLQLTSFKTARQARALINKIEAMEVPLFISGCHDGKPCRVMAGPFRDKLYIEELRKKIKWVIGAKAAVVPFQAEDDFQMPLLKQRVAQAG